MQSPKAKKNSPIDKIKALIKAAAKSNKIKPQNLSKVKFWGYVQSTRSDISEWDARKLGGFEALKQQLFPVEKADSKPNPLSSSEIGRLTGHELSAHVASVLQSCSEEMGIPPHELTWNEFK